MTVSKQEIPSGKPKSGRVWKKSQVNRSSAQNRQGISAHLCKSYEERKAIKAKQQAVKLLESEMKEESRLQREAQKQRREEIKSRRLANELKTAQYQMINPEKLKTMSKRQLRVVRKTSVNKSGQVELINPFSR